MGSLCGSGLSGADGRRCEFVSMGGDDDERALCIRSRWMAGDWTVLLGVSQVCAVVWCLRRRVGVRWWVCFLMDDGLER